MKKPIGKPLEDYINQKKSQKECLGFIDGYKARQAEELTQNQAHVFQHCFSGLQMFVYGQQTEEQARMELAQVILYVKDWIYLGKKIATEVN
jgi:sugar (pentulose or hexulose) kinase